MKVKHLLLLFTLLFILILPLKAFAAGEVNGSAGTGEEHSNYTFNGTECNFVNHAAF